MQVLDLLGRDEVQNLRQRRRRRRYNNWLTAAITMASLEAFGVVRHCATNAAVVCTEVGGHTTTAATTTIGTSIRTIDASHRRGYDIGQRVMLTKLVDERDRMLPPIDHWIVMVKPCHAKDDVIPWKGERDKIESIGVRTDGDLGRLHVGFGLLLATVRQCDDTHRLEARYFDTIIGDELRADEITRGSAIEEEHCGMTCDESFQSNERTSG